MLVFQKWLQSDINDEIHFQLLLKSLFKKRLYMYSDSSYQKHMVHVANAVVDQCY